MLATYCALALAFLANADNSNRLFSLGDEALAKMDGSGGTVVAFSPDGASILTAGGKEARLWDARTYKPIIEPINLEHAVKSAVFSPDGKQILTAAGKVAVLWDARTGKRIRAFEHTDHVFDATFSGDGKRIATGCLDNFARIWIVDTGELHAAFKHDDGVRCVQFNSDGTRLLAGTVYAGLDRQDNPIDIEEPHASGDVFVWDIGRKRKLASLVREHYPRCRGRAVFSPDGNLVGIPAGRYGAAILDVGTGDIIADWVFVCGVQGDTTVAFTADGKKLLVAGDDGHSVLDAAAHVVELIKFDDPPNRDDDKRTHNLREIQKFLPNEQLRAGVISPDGMTIALAGTASGAWDVKSGERLVRPYVEPGRRRADWWATCVTLSPKADYVLIGFTEKQWGNNDWVLTGASYTAVWPMKRPVK